MEPLGHRGKIIKKFDKRFHCRFQEKIGGVNEIFVLHVMIDMKFDDQFVRSFRILVNLRCSMILLFSCRILITDAHIFSRQAGMVPYNWVLKIEL